MSRAGARLRSPVLPETPFCRSTPPSPGIFTEPASHSLTNGFMLPQYYDKPGPASVSGVRRYRFERLCSDRRQPRLAYLHYCNMQEPVRTGRYKTEPRFDRGGKNPSIKHTVHSSIIEPRCIALNRYRLSNTWHGKHTLSQIPAYLLCSGCMYVRAM